MKIGINGYEAVVPRFGYDENDLPKRVGSSLFCYELLRHIYKEDKKNSYRIYIPVSPTSDMPEVRPDWEYIVVPETKLWTIFGLNKKLLGEKLDLFFSTTHYSPLWLSYPQILTVLDVSYKYYPELFRKNDLLKFNLWGKYSIKTSRKIITISDSSKNDIIKEYNVPGKNVEVIYPGIRIMPQNSKMNDGILAKHKISKPFILFVGTIQPRKNLVRLIEAFSKLDTKRYDLVIIGRRGWDYEETIAAPAKFGVETSVKILESVGDEELPVFYKQAEVFVLPSLYEGFGLPVLEAMQLSCPVVTSNVSSLPEAGGDAALYFNPEKTEDIAEKINKVLADKKLREKMIKEGREQVKKFSWEKSAKQVISVFEEIGGRND